MTLFLLRLQNTTGIWLEKVATKDNKNTSRFYLSGREQFDSFWCQQSVR